MVFRIDGLDSSCLPLIFDLVCLLCPSSNVFSPSIPQFHIFPRSQVPFSSGFAFIFASILCFTSFIIVLFWIFVHAALASEKFAMCFVAPGFSCLLFAVYVSADLSCSHNLDVLFALVDPHLFNCKNRRSDFFNCSFAKIRHGQKLTSSNIKLLLVCFTGVLLIFFCLLHP